MQCNQSTYKECLANDSQHKLCNNSIHKQKKS
jgi:hypothetical protein